MIRTTAAAPWKLSTLAMPIGKGTLVTTAHPTGRGSAQVRGRRIDIPSLALLTYCTPLPSLDLEQGMYYGGGNITKVNNGSKALPYPFVTAYLRGRSDGYALKGGDATQGKLETMYDGPRPNVTIAGTCKQFKFGEKSVYQPMRKQGAIILATGGDQSNRAMGKFYEGIMVTGCTSDATDDAVQANIVAVGYRNFPTPAPTPPPPASPLGCYSDGGRGKPHDLPIAMPDLTTSDPVGECSALCGAYKYFAFEFGKQCRCGDTYGKYGKAADPSKDCNMNCAADPSVICGGVWFENVYSV